MDNAVYNDGVFKLELSALQPESFVDSDMIIQLDVYNSSGDVIFTARCPDSKIYKIGKVMDSTSTLSVATVDASFGQNLRKNIIAYCQDKDEEVTSFILSQQNILNGNKSQLCITLRKTSDEEGYNSLIGFFFSNFELWPTSLGVSSDYYYSHMKDFTNY